MIPSLVPIVEQLAPLTLVAGRIAGLFLFTPLLTSATLPMQVRAMLAVMWAVAVFGFLPAEARELPDLDLFSYAGLMFSELMIGAFMGLLAGLPIAAAQMAGYVMGYQMGLGLAQAYNPELDTQVDLVGQLLFYLGICAFIAVGGLEIMFVTVVRTFDAIPLGGFEASMAPLDLFVGLLSASFELALRVAAPVTGVVMLMMVAMGFVMKTMPQINILSVGFAVKIVGGLAMLTVCIFVIERVAAEEIARALGLVLEWAGAL